MNRYIKQLIEDLNRVAGDPPQKPHIEPPPHLEDDPVIAELALVPFKPIEEWTGIKKEVFPDMIYLNGDQCQQLNEAILRVFGSLNLSLDTVPSDIPPEILYEVLISNWDYPVQYLPSSGMDVEFCSGNPDTCPWGPYCSCGMPDDPDLYLAEEITEPCDLSKAGFEDEYFEELDGLYNDDGTKVDIDSIPLPSLCVICKLHMCDDQEENLLCLMNRNDQRNAKNFECGMFEKI